MQRELRKDDKIAYHATNMEDQGPNGKPLKGRLGGIIRIILDANRMPN